MHLSGDEVIIWQQGFVKLNETILTTWAIMLVLVTGSALVSRKLSTDIHRSRWQNFLEIIVTMASRQIEDVGLKHSMRYL